MQPPVKIKDLTVGRLGDGKAVVSFTSPADVGGRVARYQVKVATLPILPYEQWNYRRDNGAKRNWWRATNCKAEPAPKSAGSKEKFIVTNVPDAADQPLYFAVRSFDDSNNRSAISNVFKVTYKQ